MRLSKQIKEHIIRDMSELTGKAFTYHNGQGKVAKLVFRSDQLFDQGYYVKFHHKGEVLTIFYNTAKDLVCYYSSHTRFNGDYHPIFKNYWHAYAYALKIQKRGAKK